MTGEQARRERRGGLWQNRAALLLVVLYLVVLSIVSSIACFFAYKQKQGELLSAMDITRMQVAMAYQDITENFWQIYMPLFENRSTAYLIMQDYYTENTELSPTDKLNLTKALSLMAIRNDKVQWIAVYSPSREINYLYCPSQDSLMVIEDNFPYLQEMQNKSAQMEIYGTREVSLPGAVYDSLAICGGTAKGMGGGMLLAGFSVDALVRMADSTPVDVPSLQYHIVMDGQSLFSTDPQGAPILWKSGLSTKQDSRLNLDHRRLFVRAALTGSHRSMVYYTVDWWAFFTASHRATATILLVVGALAALSVGLYILILRLITSEVGVIIDGLQRIGAHQLSYRIDKHFRQNDFNTIARSVNAMAATLGENIERTHYYQRKQHEAELQELQAKFNPHFLYNSLELFRARCYQNGDDETADLIAQTASLFRGYIGSRSFIPLREELAFSRRYLALFKARYGESVRILYDIDSDVLEYGIIRNVLQPLIENYFVHGLDSSRDDNYIRFLGHILDRDSMVIITEDNGLGMSEEELERLSASLSEPVVADHECYGLKNLHQRLLLYYGEGYGLTVRRNEDRGMSIQMTVKRQLSVDD